MRLIHKSVLVGAKKYTKRSNNIKITIITLLSVSSWESSAGFRGVDLLQANSLRRSEGRGKLPDGSCSGQCVIVIKVNVKEGD